MTFAKKICGERRGRRPLAVRRSARLGAGAAAAAAPAVANPGNNAWMMTSTVLVLLMILPGLALFYGGLTRTKNMLSTMTQIGAVRRSRCSSG